MCRMDGLDHPHDPDAKSRSQVRIPGQDAHKGKLIGENSVSYLSGLQIQSFTGFQKSTWTSVIWTRQSLDKLLFSIIFLVTLIVAISKVQI